MTKDRRRILELALERLLAKREEISAQIHEVLREMGTGPKRRAVVRKPVISLPRRGNKNPGKRHSRSAPTTRRRRNGAVSTQRAAAPSTFEETFETVGEKLQPIREAAQRSEQITADDLAVTVTAESHALFSCDLCGSPCSTAERYRRHMERVHGKAA